MTGAERLTLYLATFQKLKEQAREQVPPELLETWLGGPRPCAYHWHRMTMKSQISLTS